MTQPLTADSTIRDAIISELEKGFFYAIREQIKLARMNPTRVQVAGIDQFNDDIMPLLRLVGDQASNEVPKELEPEWLKEIDAILNRVASELWITKE